MCLPVSPKFFQSLKASRLGIFLLQSDVGRRKPGPRPNLLSIQSDGRKNAKDRIKARHIRLDEISTWDEDGTEQFVLSNEQQSTAELSTDHNLRTTQVAVTTSERHAVSAAAADAKR